MAYRILIHPRGDRSIPMSPASNWMGYADALRFARDWQAQFPNDPVRIVTGNVDIAFRYANVER